MDVSAPMNLRKGFLFAMLENVLKPIEPLIVLVCAAVFVGGPWGVFKYYESWVYLIFRIAVFALDRTSIWYFAQAVDPRAYLRQLSRSINFAVLIGVGLLSLSALASAGWILGGDLVHGKNGDFKVGLLLTLVYLANIPLMIAWHLMTQALINKQCYKPGIFIRTILLPLGTFGLALGLYFATGSRDALPYCFLGSNIIAFGIALVALIRHYEIGLADWSFRPWPNRPIFKYALPLAGAEILQSIGVRLDVFFVAGLAGVQALEVYNIVSMLAKTLASLRQSFEPILLSSLSMDRGNLDAIRQKFQNVVSLVMSLKIPILMLCAVWGTEILGLIGPSYATGYVALVFLLSIVTLCTVTDFSAVLVYSMAKTWVAPIFTAVFLALGALLNSLLIPRYGVTGAALAQGLATSLAGLIWYVVSVRSFRPEGLFPARALAALFLPICAYLPALYMTFAGGYSTWERGLAYAPALLLHVAWWRWHYGAWSIPKL